MKQFGTTAAGALCGVMLAACGLSMHAAAAGSVEDVYDAMRDIGMSEAMVQQARNQYATIPHDADGMSINGHYATYEAWAEYVYIYEDAIWETINKQFFPPQSETPSAVTTAAPASEGGSTVTTAATSVRTDEDRKAFIKMTLAEKKAYVSSLPADQQAAFLQNLTTAERNSIIKQLDAESKSEIAQGFIDLSKQLGMNITVDNIDKNGIDYSVRDDNGNLIDSSTIGTQVDNTGWDLTLPIAGASGMLFAAVGGIALNTAHSRKREEDSDV